ncbi:uri1, prefoldin-like chaperone [Blastocladiella emersonii ATCC 22665]|nr:uri1, prefoldin-like chaperone [Blastocladiella emersonii ATCC 22665]
MNQPSPTTHGPDARARQSAAATLAQWAGFRDDYAALRPTLAALPAKTAHPVMVPLGPLAFMPGTLVHTNEITVLLGDNWFVERSAAQAVEIVDRRIALIDEKLHEARAVLGEDAPAAPAAEEEEEEEEDDVGTPLHLPPNAVPPPPPPPHAPLGTLTPASAAGIVDGSVELNEEGLPFQAIHEAYTAPATIAAAAANVHPAQKARALADAARLLDRAQRAVASNKDRKYLDNLFASLPDEEEEEEGEEPVSRASISSPPAVPAPAPAPVVDPALRPRKSSLKQTPSFSSLNGAIGARDRAGSTGSLNSAGSARHVRFALDEADTAGETDSEGDDDEDDDDEWSGDDREPLPVRQAFTVMPDVVERDSPLPPPPPPSFSSATLARQAKPAARGPAVTGDVVERTPPATEFDEGAVEDAMHRREIAAAYHARKSHLVSQLMARADPTTADPETPHKSFSRTVYDVAAHAVPQDTPRWDSLVAGEEFAWTQGEDGETPVLRDGEAVGNARIVRGGGDAGSSSGASTVVSSPDAPAREDVGPVRGAVVERAAVAETVAGTAQAQPASATATTQSPPRRVSKFKAARQQQMHG